MSRINASEFVIVELSANEDGELESLREASGFWSRVRSLGLPTVVLAPPPVNGIEELPLRRSLSECAAWARSQELDRALVLGGDQLFFDPEVVTRGRTRWAEIDRDYFSQWEHTRIPVGIGVRMARLEALARRPETSALEAIAALGLESKSLAYDDTRHVGFELARLDARGGTSLVEALRSEGRPASWDLPGFASFGGRLPNLSYRSAVDARHVDERGMPARYGFESRECAEFPTYVMFDATNLCNARCNHCPQGIAEVRQGFLDNPTFLEPEIFQKVIDECAQHPVDFIRITADGEPLLHKGLFDLLEYAKARGVGPIGLTSNASLLTEAKAKALLNSGVAMVDFSLDAVSKEVFEQVRIGLNHGRVMGNIRRFLRLREEMKAPVKVMVSFVEQELNRHEVEEFRETWTPLVDEVLIREMISNVNLNDVTRDDRVEDTERWPCPHYFRRVVINYDGWIKACPIDWKSETRYRSLAHVGIHEAWHGDHYWRNRMEHLNLMFSETSACGPCDDWIGTPWNLGYEKMVKKLELSAHGAGSEGAE